MRNFSLIIQTSKKYDEMNRLAYIYKIYSNDEMNHLAYIYIIYSNCNCYSFLWKMDFPL